MKKELAIQDLVAICRVLASEGKTPSVGLLRAKAPGKVSVSEAISAIRYFNNSQGLPSADEKPEPKPVTTLALEKRVIALENAVATLEARLAKAGL